MAEVYIQLDAADPNEEYTMLDRIEISVTRAGNPSSSRWQGNQEQDAGECSDGWMNPREREADPAYVSCWEMAADLRIALASLAAAKKPT